MSFCETQLHSIVTTKHLEPMLILIFFIFLLQVYWVSIAMWDCPQTNFFSQFLLRTKGNFQLCNSFIWHRCNMKCDKVNNKKATLSLPAPILSSFCGFNRNSNSAIRVRGEGKWLFSVCCFYPLFLLLSLNWIGQFNKVLSCFVWSMYPRMWKTSLVDQRREDFL